jgi:hypothetical protein
MVTGWNEWIAGRWGKPGEPPVFVDQYDEEHSRDIEPMRGGHGDDYYWQLVANIRRYKGAPPIPSASAPRTIPADGGFDAWRTVAPEYADHAGDTEPRDHAGVAGLHYENRTGRNDILACKVAHDARNLYFYVRTREPITPHTDANWMWLLLRVHDNSAASWEGYDFIVNRSVADGGSTWLERSAGGWKWTRKAKVRYNTEGRELQITIPRAALGLAGGKARVQVDFKWADNIQHPGDIEDFYVSGDVAPEGRFRYRYSGE